MQGTLNEQKILHHQHRSSRKRRQAAGLVKRHHHPSQEMKREEKLIRDAQHEARDAFQPDRNMMLMETDREAEIDRLIRSAVGNNEDMIQDAWVKVLESKASSDNEIIEASAEAREKTSKVNNQHLFAERSLFEPLGQDKEGELTLETLLPDTYVDEQPKGADAPTKFTRPCCKRTIQIDVDMASLLRQRYPDRTYKDGIRLLLGLQPTGINRAWQEWEDEIIREKYPYGGTFACQIDLSPKRTQKQINSRAHELGVKVKDRRLRGHPDWVSVPDLASHIGCSELHVRNLMRDNLLEFVPLPKGKVFTRQMITKFLHEHPFKYRHEKVDGFCQYVPQWLFEWVTVYEASKQVALTPVTIGQYAREGYYPSHCGVNGKRYVRVKDVQYFLETRQEGFTHQPFKVVQGNTCSHYVINERRRSLGRDNEYVIEADYYCSAEIHSTALVYKQPSCGIDFEVKNLRGYPTCKRCLLKYYSSQKVEKTGSEAKCARYQNRT